MKPTALIVALLSTLLAADAAAQTRQRLEAELAVGQIGEDTLLETRLAFLLFGEVPGIGCSTGDYEQMRACRTSVRVVSEVPIRFELVDDPPSDSELVRTEDWNDPGDFFRLVRQLEYGRPSEPLHARFGELGATLVGHGTIVNGYSNNIIASDFRPGAEAHANSAYGGIHLLIDDVTAPHLVGGRGYVRPWGFGDRTRWWHRAAFGISAISDFRAPTVLAETNAVGFRATPPVEEFEPVTIAGVDAELSLVDEGKWRLLPYLDGNAGQGVGAHLGLSTKFLPTDRVSIGLRLEGRAFAAGYVPDYFGPLYEVERYRMTGWGAPIAAPRARVAASADRGYGGFGQLTLGIADLGSLSVAASEHDGEGDTSWRARVSITPPIPLVLGAWVARSNVDTDDLFGWDGTVLASEARVGVWGPFYLQGRVDRLYQLARDGRYQSVTEWFAGAGAAFALFEE